MMNLSFDQQGMIMVGGFLFCLVFPQIFSFFKQSGINKSINKLRILFSLLFENKLLKIAFMIICILLGYMVITEVPIQEKDDIFMVVIGALMILFPVLYLLHTCLLIVNILIGNYEIKQDFLINKNRFRSKKNGHRRGEYDLYFNEYYNNTQKSILVSYFDYINAEVGDVFYLVYVKGSKMPLAFHSKKFILKEKLL